MEFLIFMIFILLTPGETVRECLVWLTIICVTFLLLLILSLMQMFWPWSGLILLTLWLTWEVRSYLAMSPQERRIQANRFESETEARIRRITGYAEVANESATRLRLQRLADRLRKRAEGRTDRQ